MMIDSAPKVNPFKAGLLCRCPRCGKGKLFSGYLKVARSCSVCGLDFAFADSGDGPAIFIIFVVGFLVMGMALIVDMLVHPPVYIHLLLWVPATLILCFALLPPFKAAMVALQYRHDAHEAR